MTKEAGTIKGEIRLLQCVWQAARGYRCRILLTILAQIAVGLMPAGITYFVQEAITGTEEVGRLLSPANLLMLMGAIFATTLIKQFSGMIQGYSMADVKRNIERKYINHLRSCGGPSDNRSVIAFSKESEMLTGLIPMVYRSFIQAPLTVLSFLLLMIWVSWTLTAVAAAIVAAVVQGCILLRKRVKATRHTLYGRMADLYQTFADWLKGHRVLRFYDSEGLLSRRMEHVVDDGCTLSKRLVRMSAIQNVAIELLTYAGVIAFVLVVATGNRGSEWKILLTYPLAILYIRSEATKIVQGYTQLTATESSARHIPAAFMAEQSQGKAEEIRHREPYIGLPPRITSMALDGITFGYDAESPVLSHASAFFTMGGVNVLAGESGTGKSTSLDILALALTPSGGSVLINGEPAHRFNPVDVNSRMALVEQEPYMFEGTFLDNITLGKSHDHAEILSLCNHLKLSHLISQEADLLHNVSDSGHNLSVGEKQRLAFIRALLKKPDVLLLDEATSSVDSETSDIMMSHIKDIASNTLVICVSHDPKVIAMADALFRINKRKIEQIHRMGHEKQTDRPNLP